jgi:hypothetical protein
MKKHLLFLIGLLLLGPAFAETTPSRRAFANFTSTMVTSSLNPSTVGASVTFTATVANLNFYSPQTVNEGTVTFSEGATVLAADVTVANGTASFSTSALGAGVHVITATYNGTANFGTSTGSIAQTVYGTDPCPTYTNNIAYVNASATVGTNDGTTWARAFLTLQAALDAARTCGVTQIWVAQGTYVPTTYPIGLATALYTDGTLTSADYSFHLVDGVAIYGGFSGTETQLSQRNWRQNPTILSGNNTCYHVVTSANDGGTTRLDGFTVTGGNATGSGNLTAEGAFFSRGYGGGVNLQSSSLRLENLVVTGNAATSIGGISASNGSPTLMNVAVFGHSTGGMAYITSAAPGLVITITNAVFAGNSASGGGGLQLNGYRMTANLTNVVFANNTASRGGGLLNAACTTNLVNCTFYNNSTSESGGAMYNVNGATVTDKNGIYYNNTNNGNTAYNGVLNYSSDTFTATTTLTGTDPKFVNPANPIGPDNVWMTDDDGLALQSTSPAVGAGIAAGAPATDIRGYPRKTPPDQGAYEYSSCVTPTAFSLTGGGSYCAGGSGVAVGLSGSESGLSYQLKRDGTNVGSAVSGTGSALGFGTFTTAGTYTVVASRSETCTATMTGSATVTVNALPTPSITAGGATTFCAGGSVGLSTGSYSAYVWKNGNTQVGTNPTYSATASGSYTVTVTDANGCQGTSDPLTVTVNPNPVLSSATASPNPLCEGNQLTLTASASGGTGSLSYAWSGPNAYSASTNPATRTVGLSDGGAYSVTVTDANQCQASGQTPTVSVTPKTKIQGLTPSQLICPGQPFQVAVQAVGSGLSYQWYRQVGAKLTQLIPGATSATSTIPAQYLPGTLYVVVNGSCGKDSAFVTLTGKAPTVLTVTSVVSSVCEGGSLTLSVNGSGPGSLSFVWTKGSPTGPVVRTDVVASGGVGTSSLTLTNAQVSDAATYFCTLTSECTTAQVSIPVQVRYLRITTQPQSVNLCSGQTTLSVGVQAVGVTPSYQWRRNGVNVAGATGASLVVPSSRPGSYTVVVTTGCASLTSNAAVVGCSSSRLSAESVDPEYSGGLVVAPNPVSGGVIHCRVSGLQNPQFRLSTATGRGVGIAVKTIGENEFMLTPNERLTAGVYVLQAEEASTRLTQRVLVVE